MICPFASAEAKVVPSGEKEIADRINPFVWIGMCGRSGDSKFQTFIKGLVVLAVTKLTPSGENASNSSLPLINVGSAEKSVVPPK